MGGRHPELRLTDLYVTRFSSQTKGDCNPRRGGSFFMGARHSPLSRGWLHGDGGLCTSRPRLLGSSKDITSSPNVPAKWRWLNADALQALQQIENDHPAIVALPRRRDGAFEQQIVALDQHGGGHEYAMLPPVNSLSLRRKNPRDVLLASFTTPLLRL